MFDDLIQMSLDNSVYGLEKEEKQSLLLSQLNFLHKHHFNSCDNYRMISDSSGLGACDCNTFDEFLYLSVQMFKKENFMSIKSSDVYRTMMSSGTTSHNPSKIYLDRLTATYQTKALVNIFRDLLGGSRVPMLILDHASVSSSIETFSARGAGIRGLSILGRDHCYALKNENFEVDLTATKAFLTKYKEVPILIFGFTGIAWLAFQQLRSSGISLENATFIHSGGWKKLQEISVSNEHFKETLNGWFGLKRIHNFYGMVEQTGGVHVECEYGYLHTPIFGDILFRDPETLDVLPKNVTGIAQVFSALPYSYPGHSLLTEDLGSIIGEDDCQCGRKGKYFLIDGRVKKVEERGCSGAAS